MARFLGQRMRCKFRGTCISRDARGLAGASVAVPRRSWPMHYGRRLCAFLCASRHKRLLRRTFFYLPLGTWSIHRSSFYRIAARIGGLRRGKFRDRPTRLVNFPLGDVDASISRSTNSSGTYRTSPNVT